MTEGSQIDSGGFSLTKSLRAILVEVFIPESGAAGSKRRSRSEIGRASLEHMLSVPSRFSRLKGARVKSQHMLSELPMRLAWFTLMTRDIDRTGDSTQIARKMQSRSHLPSVLTRKAGFVSPSADGCADKNHSLVSNGRCKKLVPLSFASPLPGTACVAVPQPASLRSNSDSRDESLHRGNILGQRTAAPIPHNNYCSPRSMGREVTKSSMRGQ